MLRRAIPLALLLALPASIAAQPAQPATAGVCRNDANYRAQDFTVGEWDVYTGAAKTAEVSMKLILNDCVIDTHIIN